MSKTMEFVFIMLVMIANISIGWMPWIPFMIFVIANSAVLSFMLYINGEK